MNASDQVTTIVSFILFVILVFLFAITLAVRYRRRRQETEELKARFVEERLKIQLEIQEETLRHIGRELHDNLGQIASLIKINLNTINPSDERFPDKMENIKNLTRQLINDLKLLSIRLSDNQVVENGLVQAIEKEVLRLNKAGLFTASLSSEGNYTLITDDKAIVLYRMVQEVINNFIKHSGGSELHIHVLSSEKSITLELADNGVGFDTTSRWHEEGAGLKNLRFRAHLINATLDIDSQTGAGTTITIKLAM